MTDETIIIIKTPNNHEYSKETDWLLILTGFGAHDKFREDGWDVLTFHNKQTPNIERLKKLMCARFLDCELYVNGVEQKLSVLPPKELVMLSNIERMHMFYMPVSVFLPHDKILDCILKHHKLTPYEREELHRVTLTVKIFAPKLSNCSLYRILTEPQRFYILRHLSDWVFHDIRQFGFDTPFDLSNIDEIYSSHQKINGVYVSVSDIDLKLLKEINRYNIWTAIMGKLYKDKVDPKEFWSIVLRGMKSVNGKHHQLNDNYSNYINGFYLIVRDWLVQISGNEQCERNPFSFILDKHRCVIGYKFLNTVVKSEHDMITKEILGGDTVNKIAINPPGETNFDKIVNELINDFAKLNYSIKDVFEYYISW